MLGGLQWKLLAYPVCHVSTRWLHVLSEGRGLLEALTGSSFQICGTHFEIPGTLLRRMPVTPGANLYQRRVICGRRSESLSRVTLPLQRQTSRRVEASIQQSFHSSCLHRALPL